MDTFKAIVEIPAGSSSKYEINPENNQLILDFVYRDGLTCPFNYGFVPNTLAKDDDPLDVIIISSFYIYPKNEVEVKPKATESDRVKKIKSYFPEPENQQKIGQIVEWRFVKYQGLDLFGSRTINNPNLMPR